MVKVDPVDYDPQFDVERRITITRSPGRLAQDNPSTGQLKHNETGVVLAVIQYEEHIEADWELQSTTVEALVFINGHLGWGNAAYFTVI